MAKEPLSTYQVPRTHLLFPLKSPQITSHHPTSNLSIGTSILDDSRLGQSSVYQLLQSSYQMHHLMETVFA